MWRGKNMLMAEKCWAERCSMEQAAVCHHPEHRPRPVISAPHISAKDVSATDCRAGGLPLICVSGVWPTTGGADRDVARQKHVDGRKMLGRKMLDETSHCLPSSRTSPPTAFFCPSYFCQTCLCHPSFCAPNFYVALPDCDGPAFDPACWRQYEVHLDIMPRDGYRLDHLPIHGHAASFAPDINQYSIVIPFAATEPCAR